MKIDVHHHCEDFTTYRSARVKSLFNAESGCNFDLEADLPIDNDPWKIGVIVGPSGSGKTSIGRQFWGEDNFYTPSGWPTDYPIIDAICPGGDFNSVTGALSSVGLGSVPSWLRPYHVLSNGEKFRADLAKIVSEHPDRVVIDEFTSVVDRQIAQIGAMAFAKAWRRTSGQCVLLSCHYDILDWLQPDWIYDTATNRFARGLLRRRPEICLDIWQTNWGHWPHFEPHHYLKLPHMVAATNYVGTVNGELVAHVAVSTIAGMKMSRACRLVIMPEWQGAGIGMHFLNSVCQMWLDGNNRYNKPMPTVFHTSHPGLAAALRRDKKWEMTSAVLHGANKARCIESLKKSAAKVGNTHGGGGFGGHFRAVQGFRYLGKPAPVYDEVDQS
jgi:GNAT superfamily N-acetyltransferase